MKKGVLFLILGVVVILGTFFVTQQNNLFGTKEETNTNEQQDNSRETEEATDILQEDEAIQLASKWHSTHFHVMAGGDYKENEYQSFEYDGTPYRYFAGNLSTKEKLLAELTASVTVEIAEQFIEHYGYIEHDGKMAQPEADGGSLEEWNKATAKLISNGNNPVFEFTVPLGETGTTNQYEVEYDYVKNAGWRISKLPTVIQ